MKRLLPIQDICRFFFYFLNIFGLWLGMSEDMEPLDKEGYLCVPNILLQRAEPQP